ncbi:hypothetical protein OKW29_000314 [Paraburkholderia sp. CI3]
MRGADGQTQSMFTMSIQVVNLEPFRDGSDITPLVLRVQIRIDGMRIIRRSRSGRIFLLLTVQYVT